MKQVIVNADDFGISEGATEAIVDAHVHGIVTSTSVMANMPGFEAAVRLREAAPDLAYGAHLSLTVGRPLLGAEAVPLLCDGAGWLHGSFLVHAARSTGHEYRRQARRELTAQLEKLKDHGFEPDHVNGQSHVHMIPLIHRIFRELQATFSIPWLRFTGESFHGHPAFSPAGLLKNAVIRSCAAFAGRPVREVASVGLNLTGRMDERALIHYVRQLRESPTELMVHPGTGRVGDVARFQDWVADYLVLPDRAMEWDALKSREVRAEVERQGVRLTTFGRLATS